MSRLLMALIASALSGGMGNSAAAPVLPAGGVLYSSLGLSAGDPLTVDQGTALFMDVQLTPKLGVVENNGSILPWQNGDCHLRCDSLVQNGVFHFDSGQGYFGRFRLTLGGQPWTGRIVGPNAGTSANDNGGSQRALMMNPGSSTRLVGNRGVIKTHLNDHANVGDHILVLEQALSGKAGDRIAISPTDYVPGAGHPNRTEVYTLAADVTTNMVTTVEPIRYFRWGKLQYATDSGLSLTPGPTTTKPHPNVPTVLDERALVMLLDSNVTIEGADDTSWANDRFGGHCMAMGLSTEAVFDDVLFERMGQPSLGRYPMHWHMASYNVATGVNLGDYAPGTAVMSNCSVYNSSNRMATIHGSRGVTLQGNVGAHIKGHAVFLEDGSEEANVIDDNWVSGVDDPGDGYRIKNHDGGAAGFWITNARNQMTRNKARDANRGIWYAPQPCFGPQINGSGNSGGAGWHHLDDSYVGGCLGLSKKAAIYPFYNSIQQWEDNEGGCCFDAGAVSNDFVIDEFGNTAQGKIQSTSNNYPGPDYGNPLQIPSLFRGTRTFKNSGGAGYLNRISNPEYEGWVAADNPGDCFNGQTDSGFGRQHLLIARSLNHSDATMPGNAQPIFCGFATYHGTLKFTDIWAFNFSGDPWTKWNGRQSGPPTWRRSALSESWDLYLNPIFKYFTDCTGWVCINSVPMHRTPPNHILQPIYSSITSDGVGVMDGNRVIWHDYTLAGALYDASGTLANNPSLAGQYVVYDHPFLTQGVNKTSHGPGTFVASTPSPYYGLMWSGCDAWQHGQNAASLHTVYTQIDKATQAPIAGAVWDVPAQWDNNDFGSQGNEYPHGYPAGTAGDNIGNPGPFHHAAMPKGSRVYCDIPNLAFKGPNKNLVLFYIQNLQTQDDVLEFGFSWDGTVAPRIGASWNMDGSTYHFWMPYGVNSGTAVDLEFASLAAFNASTQQGFWRDTANNKLWVRMRGFRDSLNNSDTADFWFRVTPASAPIP